MKFELLLSLMFALNTTVYTKHMFDYHAEEVFGCEAYLFFSVLWWIVVVFEAVRYFKERKRE